MNLRSTGFHTEIQGNCEITLECRLEICGQGTEEALEDARAHPLLEAPMTRLIRRIARRQNFPLCSSAQDPENPVKDGPGIAPEASPAIRATGWCRDDRFEDVPLLVREIHGRYPPLFA
jgi:hypothetical protein